MTTPSTLKVTDSDGIPAFARQTVTVGLPGVLWERTYANTQDCLDQTTCTRGVKSYDIIEVRTEDLSSPAVPIFNTRAYDMIPGF